MLSTVSALACYIFDNYQPILIIFVDSKAVVLSTVCKYYFSLGHICVTPVRQQDQYVISCVDTVSSAATITMVDPPSNPKLLQQHW